MAGWGTYDTEEDCLAAGGFAAADSGIDPTTYPAPNVQPSSCGYDPNTRSRCAREWVREGPPGVKRRVSASPMKRFSANRPTFRLLRPVLNILPLAEAIYRCCI